MAKTKKDLDSDRTQNVLRSSLDVSTRLLSTEDLARMLAIPVTTLYTWRYKGTGRRPTELASISAIGWPT